MEFGKKKFPLSVLAAENRLRLKILKLLQDFPVLREAGVIDDMGNATGHISREDLITLFYDNNVPVETLIGVNSESLGLNLRIYTDSIPEQHQRILLFGNLKLNEAVLQRIEKRTKQAGHWAAFADQIQDALDAMRDAGINLPEYCTIAFDAAERWYDHALKKGGARAAPSVKYNYAALLHNHGPAEHSSVREAVSGYLLEAAGKGYGPALDNVATLLVEGYFEDQGQCAAAIDAVLRGAQVNPGAAGNALAALLDIHYLVEGPEQPNRPGESVINVIPNPQLAIGS